MDPNINLVEQLELAETILEEETIAPEDAYRLAELVLALDQWIVNGGFLPSVWQRSRRSNNPSSTAVSVWFSKDRFHTPASAKRWIIDQGGNFSMAHHYETDGFWAFPQMSEREEEKYRGRIRSKYITEGVLLKFVPARFAR